MISMAATIPRAGAKPALPKVWPNPTEAPAAVATNTSQSRRVKACPALIRFFHNKATGCRPVGRSLKGGRLFLGFLPAACQLPERTAADFSAIFRDASTEASSKATLERITQRYCRSKRASAGTAARRNDCAVGAR